MPRANRHYISGYICHIIHRCHKQEFLFKLVKDRQRWIHWLFEAKKRFGLRILNFVVTSNYPPAGFRQWKRCDTKEYTLACCTNN
jgi:REP element-mobilizing transposase RayT